MDSPFLGNQNKSLFAFLQHSYPFHLGLYFVLTSFSKSSRFRIKASSFLFPRLLLSQHLINFVHSLLHYPHYRNQSVNLAFTSLILNFVILMLINIIIIGPLYRHQKDITAIGKYEML